ncbi:deoxynucleoside kinase [Virgibacillus sp. MSJ-26]|uniref:deoxynucleoside kinase n=1 Tax=Virgibacillus sp. MSJ-26 TaxID=2841522 RepID=UPI001C0F5BED|nr:deoxynucleoside kinase [Virgibacillus sp. MSJ-26]MBU5467446.1 deoxynucleoside kinase [Virgibacillus sp. MSJ-26]
MENVPFIAIEGPIGAGKTSLASKLANYFNFQLLKEIVEENPFLDKFYDNIEEWSFQTEMFFLCNRYKQLEDIERNYLDNGKPVIADYHILKNIIFARRTLQKDKLEKYEQIYKILTKDVAIPNVMIYIHASLDTLLKRIECRGRDIEHNIQPEYLMQLSNDYDEYMNHFERLHPHVPLIRINGDETDFVTRQKDLLDIIEQVKNKLNNIKRSKPDESKRKV